MFAWRLWPKMLHCHRRHWHNPWVLATSVRSKLTEAFISCSPQQSQVRKQSYLCCCVIICRDFERRQQMMTQKPQWVFFQERKRDLCFAYGLVCICREAAWDELIRVAVVDGRCYGIKCKFTMLWHGMLSCHVNLVIRFPCIKVLLTWTNKGLFQIKAGGG